MKKLTVRIIWESVAEAERQMDGKNTLQKRSTVDMELEQLTNEPTSEMLPILEVDDFLEKFLK